MAFFPDKPVQEKGGIFLEKTPQERVNDGFEDRLESASPCGE